MSWLNLGLLTILAIGHAALVIAVMNRLYGYPFPCRVLDLLRTAHDILVLGFPVALVWFVGLNGPGLLRGGSWSALHPALFAYLALCGVTAALIPVFSVLRTRQPLPKAQISNHSYTIDIAAKLGYRPTGPGPHQRLARLPGNEQFSIEVSEKVYRLPRVPTAWDGLTILHLTDLHFIGTIDRPYFEKVLESGMAMNPDLIALTGDVLDDPNLIDWLPETLGKMHAPEGCYFVLGNHDREVDTPALRHQLEELGWQDVSGRSIVKEIAGFPLVIAGSERPWMGNHPDLSHAPPEAFRFLLSHTPDNIGWARRNQIDLMLAGHNHGGQVRLPLIGPIYSPSHHGCRYSSGVFWEDPTLLYVSRGVSSRHPIRWRCKPELTQLVLRPPQGGEQPVRHAVG